MTETPAAVLDEPQARAAASALVASCGFAAVGSNGPHGYPWVKTMIKMEVEQLTTVWFSTNTSSSRVSHFRADPRACVYFVDTAEYRGLLLLGTMEVLADHVSRARVWRPGNEVYYPQGVDDPDHSVLRFTATRANYYEGLRNVWFDV